MNIGNSKTFSQIVALLCCCSLRGTFWLSESSSIQYCTVLIVRKPQEACGKVYRVCVFIIDQVMSSNVVVLLYPKMYVRYETTLVNCTNKCMYIYLSKLPTVYSIPWGPLLIITLKYTQQFNSSQCCYSPSY